MANNKVEVCKCIGSCGRYVDDPSGYCDNCQPDEDLTRYDTGDGRHE